MTKATKPRRAARRVQADVGPREEKVIARQVADRLFDRSFGRHVKRLGQITDEKQVADKMSGWCHAAVMAQVVDVLKGPNA